MPSGHVTYAERDGIHVLRYFGRIDYPSAPGLHGFLDDLLAHRPCRGLVFDLSGAESLDSTHLGLIARVADGWQAATGARSLVVSTNEDVTSVLRSMCLYDVVELIEARPEEALAQSERRIEPGAPSTDELRHTMLEAHRALVKLSESGRLAFQDVVACLESPPVPGAT
jgi:anti-anti-sigma factor